MKGGANEKGKWDKDRTSRKADMRVPFVRGSNIICDGSFYGADDRKYL